MAFAPASKEEKKVAVIAKLFLVGASIIKRAQLLQSLVFFLFLKDRLEATNVKINVQLLITVLNYWTGKRGAHLG